MPALQPSRRELLGTGLVAAEITVAGCSNDAPADSETEASMQRVPDPATASLRGPVDTPLVRLPTESDDTGDAGNADSGRRDAATTGDGDADSESERQPLLVLAESSDVDSLEYDRDQESGNDIRSLLAATNFDEESVIVHQERVGECYERRLEYAEGNSHGFSLQFCQVERDASIACALEREQLQATFVRVPFAYDAEPTERTVGVSSSCETQPGADDGSDDGGEGNETENEAANAADGQ